MRTNTSNNDLFREKIRQILLDAIALSARGDFKSRIFAEVQNYSRELQEADYDSDLFYRLLELIVDCQSLSMPDNWFKMIVAGLLCDSKDLDGCPDEQVRQLMDTESFERAKESFINKQCVVSALSREKTGRKGGIMAGKRNFSKAEDSQ
ncbi:MAG TPA: hypothetical protein VEF34_15980 [Syntrophobacteraceae bacterium]|nr:hypothetical protein [Syntrophobacteraceae bacterium]